MASAYDELSDPQFTHGKELIALLDIGPGEYADRKSGDGIRLERYVLLAVAEKNRTDDSGRAVLASARSALRIGLTVSAELLQDDLHFDVGQDVRRTDLQRAPVLLGERLDLDRERERCGERCAHRYHPVIGEQASLAAVERA